MLASDIKNLREAYNTIYSTDNSSEISSDEEFDSIIEEVVQELVEECVDLGYSIEEASEFVQEATVQYLAELNPYAPAGSKEASAYNKSTTASKRSAERKAAIKSNISNLKRKVVGKAAGAIVGAHAAAAKTKEVAGSATTAAKKVGSAAVSGVKSAGSAVSTAAKGTKEKIKSGVRGLIGKGLSAVAGGAGMVAQKARKVGSAASKAAEKYAESVDCYDVVLEYLFDNGHVDTLEEAHYVMMQLDEETINSIIGEEIYED